MYAVLHFGGHDVSCALRAWEGRAAYDRMKNDLLARYARYSLADMVRGIDEHFPGETFGLPNLFLDERRLALARVIASVLARHEETYRRIWEENRGLVALPAAAPMRRSRMPWRSSPVTSSSKRSARRWPSSNSQDRCPLGSRSSWARRPRWG